MNTSVCKVLFTVSAAVCFGPAVILLIAPGVLMAVYGLTLDSAGVFLGRVLGAVLIGLAILFWSARQSQAKDLHRAAAWAGLIHNALLVIVILIATISGGIIWTGWPAAGLHAGIMIAFWFMLANARGT
ncbi:MAG: hypothetical protein HC853_01250 [Anaerolineae bacterium]|nr:hypothetical protein [Anaerolineae bacterium]